MKKKTKKNKKKFRKIRKFKQKKYKKNILAKRFKKSKAKRKKKFKVLKRKIKNKKVFKTQKKLLKIDKKSKQAIIQIISLGEKLKSSLKFNFNIDQLLQSFFQGISKKISNKLKVIKIIIEEEKKRKKEERIKKMHQEKIDAIKKNKDRKTTCIRSKRKRIQRGNKIN